MQGKSIYYIHITDVVLAQNYLRVLRYQNITHQCSLVDSALYQCSGTVKVTPDSLNFQQAIYLCLNMQ